MEKKLFFRVSNTDTQQGLWYDFDGKFTGLIHGRFDFCFNNELPMPFDPEFVGWLSSTDSLETLFLWFTKEDILKLGAFGYKLTIYEATEYKYLNDHWLIKQDSSVLKGHVVLNDN